MVDDPVAFVDGGIVNSIPIGEAVRAGATLIAVGRWISRAYTASRRYLAANVHPLPPANVHPLPPGGGR